MIDEQKLLHNLKKRNRNSLDDIIKIYTPYISVIVYNTVGCKLSKEDMEEIVSDTFFLLWQNSLNIDETKGNMRSYLATIARNTSKNKLRKYHSNEVLNEQIISSDLTPQDNIIKAENSQFLTELITSLGEPDSEIFFRYYYYNEKIKTISKAMNISLSTVKTKLYRGKQKLKNTIIKGGLMMNKHLAKLQKELDISDTHNMPSTDIILKNVNNKINVSPEERKIYMKRKYLKITSIAAVICALAVTTAFAADSISGKIGEIISYFQNDNAVEMTSLEQLANFNDSIGKSISKDGYTLTLDNVAADDNFVHVFYTVTSENEPFYNNSDNNAPIWSNSLNVSADIQCVINGKLSDVSNNNHESGYFV